MPDKKGNHTETELSREIGDFLTLNQIPNWRVGVLDGHFRKRGTKKWYNVKTGTKGHSDRVFILTDGSGKTAYLEIKKPGKDQSDNQKDFEKNCIKYNVPYFVARSIEDVREILEALNMLKVRYV